MTCTCGHDQLVHHLTPSRVRTWCSTYTQAGQCPCDRYTEEGPPNAMAR